MFTFFGSADAPTVEGELYYVQNEHSFHYEFCNFMDRIIARDHRGTIEIIYLLLEVNLIRKSLMFIEGYHPNISWKNRKLIIPPRKKSGIQYGGDTELDVMSAVKLQRSQNLPTYFDSSSGWVCIGNPRARRDSVALEFARNSALVLKKDQIDSIWLHPKMVNDFDQIPRFTGQPD